MSGDPPKYRFHHLGFQEYLAARFYAEQRDPFKKLETYLDKGNWEEVILLTAGHLFETSVGRLGEDFLRELLKRFKDASTQWNRLILCLHAATEAPDGLIPDELLKKVKVCALEAFNDNELSLKERAQIGLFLGQLGDPRLGVHSKNRWVRISPGKFQMGSTNLNKELDEFWRNSAQPVHPVQVTKAYWLGRFPVTNAEYGAFIEDGAYERRDYWSNDGWDWLSMSEAEFQSWFEKNKKTYSWNEEWKEFYQPEKEPHFWHDSQFNGNNQPIVGITWFEAMAYCRWLTMTLRKRENRPDWWTDDLVVTLPTEAQWEYASRSSNNSIYPWGNDEPAEVHANFDQRLSATSTVGIFPEGRTQTELYDLAGNVWEWCRDIWDAEAYTKRKGGVSDPLGKKGDKNARLVRGGSWLNPPSYLAAAIRFGVGVWVRARDIGFRCCVVAAEHA